MSELRIAATNNKCIWDDTKAAVESRIILLFPPNQLLDTCC